MCDTICNFCGNCAFARPADIADNTEDKVQCVIGGSRSMPKAWDSPGCYNWRPSVAEMRKRNPNFKKEASLKARRAYYASSRVGETQSTKANSVKWTPEMDTRLRALYIDQNEPIRKISELMNINYFEVVNRVSKLKIQRTRVKKERFVFQDGNNLPLSKQKYPNIKCCKGQFCKYKQTCQHYHHWLEMGKPRFRLIASSVDCINASYSGIERTESVGVYREYIGLDGRSKPDPITFSETC